MNRIALVILALGAGLLASCEPLVVPPPDTFPLAREHMATENAIPAEYGRLVAVTTTAGDRQSYAQLWFEDANGTIRIAYVLIDDRRVAPDVDVIARRAASPAPASEATGEEETP